MSFIFAGLTRADLENSDHTGNGTSNGVDSNTENTEAILKEEEIKEEEEGAAAPVTTPQHTLTPFELEGLWNLLGKLEELPAHKKCVPAGIRNAAALLEDMRVGLSHNNLTLSTLHSNTCYTVCHYWKSRYVTYFLSVILFLFTYPGCSEAACQ